MHLDYGLVEYLRRDAESIVESQPWVTERMSGTGASIEIRDGGYHLRTGAEPESRAELRLPPFLDTADPHYDVVAIEVDLQSTAETTGAYHIGLHREDGSERLEWRSDRSEPLVVADADSAVADAPGRQLQDAYRQVHRLEFDRNQQVLRHYVGGCRSAEMDDPSVLPKDGRFLGTVVASGTDNETTSILVRRISHIAGQRRGPR